MNANLALVCVPTTIIRRGNSFYPLFLSILSNAYLSQSIFGMNVNIFNEGGPMWWWYLVVSVPAFVLITIAWLIFKYIKVCLSPRAHTLWKLTIV